MTPLVSILIPAYNAGAWLADAISSALAQTWPRKEIIIVDDGSTDQTLAVAERYATKDVTVLTQTNQGVCAARNRLFSVCQGDYIQWLDADDQLAHDKIEQQMKVVREHPDPRILLSGAWGLFSYRIRKARFTPTALWADHVPVEWLLRKMGQNLHMQPDVWLVSRELTEAAGPWDVRLKRDNDGEYFCRVILACDQVRFVPEAKSYYRFAGFNSISHIGRSNSKLESLFLSMQLHVRYLRSLEDSERTRRACLTYLQTPLIEFHPFRMDLVTRLEELARSLGGELHPPRLSWKYEWIRRTLGWRAARETQLFLNQCKANARVARDKALACMERGSRSTCWPAL